MSKVSIIIPVHNTADYIPRCVESLQAQTLQDIEIILIENGSTDDSLTVCERYAAEDPRVKVIHLDKGDVSVARNAGIKAASSEYIGFIDSDDSAEPDMFETLYSIASENGLDIMYCNFVDCMEDGQKCYKYPTDGLLHLTDTRGMLAMHYKHEIPARVCTFIVRREIMNVVPFPKKTYYEDRAISHYVVSMCKTGGYIRRPLMKYYHRDNSCVHTWTWKHYHDFCAAERGRLLYLYHTDLFTKSEKAALAKMPARWFLSKMRYLRKMSRTRDQKMAFRSMARSVKLVPQKCNLTIKTRLIKGLLNKYYL